MNTSQAFPCELDDDSCLHCEISDDGDMLEIGVEFHECEYQLYVAIGPSQIDNLIEYLQRIRLQRIRGYEEN